MSPSFEIRRAATRADFATLVRSSRWCAPNRGGAVSAALTFVAEDGVGHHHRVHVGPHLDDDVPLKAAHPAIVIGEVRSLLGRRGGVHLDDRRVTVDVEVGGLQLYPAR